MFEQNEYDNFTIVVTPDQVKAFLELFDKSEIKESPIDNSSLYRLYRTFIACRDELRRQKNGSANSTK